VQDRVLFCDPPPHEAEHSPNSLYSVHLPSTGHAGTSHFLVSVNSSSGQSAPPFFETGLLQLRSRSWKESPQLAEHCVHSLQFPNPPSIAGGAADGKL